MKHKKFWVGAAAGAFAVLAALTAILWAMQGNSVLNLKTLQKLAYLERLIDVNYLEESEEEELSEGLYTGLVYGLGDLYSNYYTADQYESQSSSTEGVYVGVGLVLQKNPEGGAMVVTVYEGGPGEAAGVEEGDIISAIDGVDVTEYEVADMVEMIKTAETGSVMLTLHRPDVEEPLELQVEITDVELPSVFHEMLEDGTGYLRITEFKGVTYEQYQTAMEDLRANGMERLVVDLRDNPGGLLTSVCDILREILPEGLIVYTEDKYGNRQEYECDGEHPLELPLAVLVNESSASASEIFAGAVQDYGIGTIVGTDTYGKGVVQAVYPLNDGSAVKLTVSKYYTPGGNSIHGEGIHPDVEVRLDSELLGKEEISYEEDNQLQEALKTFGLQDAS